MPSQKNQTQLDEIKAAIKNSQAIILTNYAGLSVAAQQELRKVLGDTGAAFSVYKNTLLKLAFQDKLGSDLPENVAASLQGQTAILVAQQDPISPIKALMNFYKDHELPQVKLGFLDGSILTASDVENISKLPAREQLLGQLAGQLNAPIYGFAQVLRANLQNLVFALDAVRRTKKV